MTKVMFLPLNFNDVIQLGVCDAFKNAGCKLEVFDYFNVKNKLRSISKVRQDLIQKVEVFKPDLMHMQIQHTTIIDGATIAEIKKRLPKLKISNITVDVRNYVQPQYRDVGRYADYNCITSTTQLKMYEQSLGKKIYYWQVGFDPKIYFPPSEYSIDKTYEYDVIFVANYTTKESYPGTKDREDVCRLLRNKFGNRFGLFGGGWPRSFKSKGSLNQRRLVNAYHKSFCAISVNHYNDLAHYFSDRLLMSMACGRPTISYRFPEWETYFTDNCDLLIANRIKDIPEMVKYLLQNKEHANFIGKSGSEKVFAEHTYFSRVKELLEIVGLK